MELLYLIIEGLLMIGEALLFAADVYSWIRGGVNRTERRMARKAGTELPPRDKWNRRVILLSVLLVVLSITLMIWRLR